MKKDYQLKDTDLRKTKFMSSLSYLKSVNKSGFKLGLLLAFTLFFTFACSDEFLNKSQLNSLADENFWKTEKDANMGVMGCYDGLQQNFVYNGSHDFCGSWTVHFDAVSDDAVYRWTWQQMEWLPRNTLAPDSWLIHMFWQNNYVVIARCNQAIAKIGAMTAEQIKPEAAQKLLAEAKFVRALIYSNMVSLYHDIPLVTVTQLPTDMPANTERAKIVDFIQKDLLDCVENLPKTRPTTEWGRVTKGAAYTLLARTNLFNIGNGGTYEKAAEYAKNVMSLGSYSLFDNYEKLFKAENEINSEVIFPVVFVRGPSDNGSAFVGSWGPTVGNYWLFPLSNLVNDYYCTNGKPIKDASGALNPLYNSNNIWNNRDPRLTATIVGEGALWAGKPIIKTDMSAEPTGFAFRKWREETGTDDRFDSPQDFYVFRHAHVLLMRAEALIMSDKFTDPDVNICVNAIRLRVGMPTVENAEAAGRTLTKDDYIKIIQHEWRVETAFEGWRFFNLIRWGELKNAYDKVNVTDRVLFPSIVPKHIYAPRTEVFPIPTAELDRNKNLKQNPLW